MKYLIFLCCFGIMLSSCTSKIEKRLRGQLIESPETQAEIDKNLILNYAIEKELDLQSTDSGIFYEIHKKGEEVDPPVQSDMVVAHYHGRLLDDKVFDSSIDRGQPLEFKLGQVIKGWQEVIPLLRKGGKGTFYIPSHLAYGERGGGRLIGPNTVLIFDIELIDYFDPSEASSRQARIDKELILAHIKENNLNMQATPSGIYYSIEQAGNGDTHPSSSNRIKAHYRGSLLDGTVFDSSYDRDKPLDFKLSGVIKGWQEAIPLLRKGGKGTFIIPSDLAYGSRGAGGVIAPNSVLVFEIELLDFK